MAAGQMYADYGQRWYDFFQKNPRAYQTAVSAGLPKVARTWEA
jgi:hypothetical protein